MKFYKKYRLVPDENVEVENDNPFEDIHARKAKKTLSELRGDILRGPPVDENERVERQQKTALYKRNFEQALANAQFGTLQETLGRKAQTENPNLEKLFKMYTESLNKKNQEKKTAETTRGRIKTGKLSAKKPKPIGASTGSPVSSRTKAARIKKLERAKTLRATAQWEKFD